MAPNQQNVVQATAMPPQTVKPLQTGATSPMSSAQIQQNQNIQAQMALIGKSGGAKRRKRFRGGANAVVVPAVPPGAVNAQETSAQYASLTKLAEDQSAQAVYDKGNTAAIAAKQGGMKGGTWPVWGCLSGGKKSKRRTKRSRKCRRTKRSRKCKKTKRR